MLRRGGILVDEGQPKQVRHCSDALGGASGYLRFVRSES